MGLPCSSIPAIAVRFSRNLCFCFPNQLVQIESRLPRLYGAFAGVGEQVSVAAMVPAGYPAIRQRVERASAFGFGWFGSNESRPRSAPHSAMVFMIQKNNKKTLITR